MYTPTNITEEERRQLSPWTDFIEVNKTGMFETRDTLTYKEAYTQYNLDNGIDDTNDIYLERKFREAVMEFLYDTNAKLYRSRTEGNILIKIMNVSFSPKRDAARVRHIDNFCVVKQSLGNDHLFSHNKSCPTCLKVSWTAFLLRGGNVFSYLTYI